MASRLYGDDPAVKTIELAPNGIIQNVYPFKENQKAIGMNMLAEHERKEAATLAKDTRKYTLEGPYDLKQGGKGALLYDPIYVNEKFWGFSILVIDWDAFLDEIHLSDLKKHLMILSFGKRIVSQRKDYYFSKFKKYRFKYIVDQM